MKKIHILLTLVFVGLLAIGLNAQSSDSTSAGGAAVTDIISGIFGVLDAVGFHVKAWQGVAVFIGGVLWRWYERKKMRYDHAQEIKKIIAATPAPISPEHEGLFKRLIHRLENNISRKKAAKLEEKAQPKTGG